MYFYLLTIMPFFTAANNCRGSDSYDNSMTSLIPRHEEGMKNVKGERQERLKPFC
jgi:hypothetical protein